MTDLVFAVKVEGGGFILRAPDDSDVMLPLAGTLLAEDGDGSQLKNLPGGAPPPWEIVSVTPTASSGSFTSVMCQIAIQINGGTMSLQGWLSSGSIGSASGPFLIPLPNGPPMESTLAAMNSATYQPLCAYLQGGSRQIVIAGPNRSTPCAQSQTIIFGGSYPIMP